MMRPSYRGGTSASGCSEKARANFEKEGGLVSISKGKAR